MKITLIMRMTSKSAHVREQFDCLQLSQCDYDYILLLQCNMVQCISKVEITLVIINTRYKKVDMKNEQKVN